MQTASQVVFAAGLSLLLVHEMDAICRQEWKMFVVLKRMGEEKAFYVFLLLHIPLYIALFLLLLSDYQVAGYYVTDVFLAFHLLLHWLFRKHPANNFTGRISKAIIVSSGLLGVLHLALLVFVL